jgi:hypothetical protein
MLCAVLIFSFSFRLVTSASPATPKNIAPYQSIINKLNKELGASISIPDDKTLIKAKFIKEEVYENITKIPLDKFEAYLRTEYEKVNSDTIYINANDQNTQNNDNNSGTRVSTPALSENSTIEPASIRQSIIQKVNLSDFYGAVDLESEVFSPTGGSGSFVYSSIYSLGYYKYTTMTHFRTTQIPTYVLSNGSKTCTGTYVGSLFTREGINLLVVKKYVITYNAG